ncbi:MAG: rhomboid family intramembrane serine protease [Flavobacteriales bacterium]|jgi:membrane associated rhomboid family serine protease
MASTPLTFIILAATILVSWRAFEQSALFEKLLHSPYRVKHQKQYYRLFSHMLVHADGIHLALNMFVFYSFGRVLEAIFRINWGIQTGSILFIALYVLGGVAATLPSLRKHSDNYGYNSVGASGGVSSLLMAYMILFPMNEIAFFFIPMPAFIGVFVFFLLEHFMKRNVRSNIAHDAHIWGALFGIVFVALAVPRSIPRFIEQVLGAF